MFFILFECLDAVAFDFGDDDYDFDVSPSQTSVRPSLGTIFPLEEPFPKRARVSGNNIINFGLCFYICLVLSILNFSF